MSVADSTFAMLRCVKHVPGLTPRMVVSGCRESEQPYQSMGGAWPAAKEGKRSGSAAEVAAAQSRLDWR